MVQDLRILKDNAKTSIENNLGTELFLPQEVRVEIYKIYKKLLNDKTATLEGNTIKTTNNSGQAAYMPLAWFSRIMHCRELIEALNTYANHVDELKELISADTVAKLPKINWRAEIAPHEVSTIDTYIRKKFKSHDEQQYFDDFLDGRSWLELKGDGTSLTGKKLNRAGADYISSSIKNICGLIKESAGKLGVFIEAYMKSEELRRLISLQYTKPSGETLMDNENRGINKIFYGAPGTGKSYEINKLIEGKESIRTVFHAETQFSDFVGMLKPQTVKDENGASSVTYQFREGPFTRALIKAYRGLESSTPVYLIIEEINRAPAATVFGEIFLLLDRDASGRSEYSIESTDPDLLEHINSNIPKPIDLISIPPNLSILATMNSSDQSVRPMDTAFKRRWSFEYIPIDYSKSTLGNIRIPITDREPLEVTWADFARTINECLQSIHVPEDRLLGHRFLSERELESEDASKNALCGKLFVYLWDDVLRHGRRELIFSNASTRTFGELVAAFKEDKTIFCDSIIEKLESYTIDTNNVPEGE